MKNKIFTRIIITTLLCAFLTFNVGKVTRVSAVGTTIAASAAAALCAVGIVYCSYMALTGASVHVPDTVENIEAWLQDMGSKVVQYPSGREAYNELYSHNLALSPEGNLIRDFIDSEVWTWTAEKIKSWTNDFSSTDVISNIASFSQNVDLTNTPTTNFDYPFSFTSIADPVIPDPQTFSDITLSQWESYGFTFTPTLGQRVIINTTSGYIMTPSTYVGQTRNILIGDYYYPQVFINNDWQTVVSYYSHWELSNGSSIWNYRINTTTGNYQYVGDSNTALPFGAYLTYPVFADSPIYVEATGETIEVLNPADVEVLSPQWPTLPPEDDNKPVIPYVKLPYDPSWVDPLGGPNGGGNWGLRLGDVLDLLEELAGLMMEIGSIGELINQFKDLIDGQSGDEYYIYYDDSNNNYYQYYTITNFGDNIYNYDINVSEVDEHLPVDLNTIQTYSNNRYLEQIKQSAINGSSIVRDLAVFWYDVDPEVTYIALGICIVILIAAFTGKLGHS